MLTVKVLNRVRALTLLLLLQSGIATAAPNIILVIVDDLGRQDVGAYGGEFYETPVLDQLAADGVRFDQAYTAHPRCVPARVGVMSGRFPARYGIPGFPDRKSGPHQLPLSAVTFAERLQEVGYRTGYVGKWHLGKDETGWPDRQGFDVSLFAGAAGAPGSYFYPFENRKPNVPTGLFPPYDGGFDGEYLTDRLTDEAIGFVEESGDQPFLLVLAHYAVHTPIQAPDALAQKYREKARDTGLSKKWSDDLERDGTGMYKTEQNHPVYAGMVESVDTNLGRLLTALEETGVDDNTIVIVTSDHGGLSSRGLESKRELATSNLPFRHGKGWLYDGGVRVPLIVRWPGKAVAGHVSDVRVTGTDHFRTILEMAGAEVGAANPEDSVSYLSALDGGHYERPPMFWHSSLGRPTQTGDTRASAVLDGDWKLIQWYSLESEEVLRTELFSVSEAPGERLDVAAAHADEFERLNSMLDAWKAEVNARLGSFGR